jgi:hypothetical protein
MNPNARTPNVLLAALLAASILSIVPAAHAASQANPSFPDSDDDAVPPAATCPVVPGGGFASCPGWDFLRCNVDLHSGWVNDTKDALLFSIAMRNPGGLVSPDYDCVAKASKGDFEYHFFFTFANTTYDAGAFWSHDGTWAVAGVANATKITPGDGTCPTVCPYLTLTVPKTSIPGLGPGTVLSGLYCTSKGTNSANANDVVGDRAPDANTGLDYVIQNGTAPRVEAWHDVTGPVFFANASAATGTPTTRTDHYNWTAPTGNLTVSYTAAVGAGMVGFRVVDASGIAIAGEDLSFSVSHTGNISLAAPGRLAITVQQDAFSGRFTLGVAGRDAVPADGPSTSNSGVPGPSPATTPGHNPPSSSTGSGPASPSKGSPGAGPALALLGLAAALIVVRRR